MSEWSFKVFMWIAGISIVALIVMLIVQVTRRDGPRTLCSPQGVSYYRGGYGIRTLMLDRDGKPVPCDPK